MPELKDSSELRQRLIEEARTRVATPPSEDEMTASILAEELSTPEKQCSKRKARIILQEMVEEGLATVRDNGIGGCKVYRLEDK